MKKTLGAMKNNQTYFDEVKLRVGALEDRSPQETRLEPVPDIGLEPLRLVPWKIELEP